MPRAALVALGRIVTMVVAVLKLHATPTEDPCFSDSQPLRDLEATCINARRKFRMQKQTVHDMLRVCAPVKLATAAAEARRILASQTLAPLCGRSELDSSTSGAVPNLGSCC